MIVEIWGKLCEEADLMAQEEPLLRGYINECVLKHNNLGSSLGFILSHKLADSVMPVDSLITLFAEAYHNSPDIIECASYDLSAVFERDPAIQDNLIVLLYLKGFHAIQIHRLAHHLWKNNRKKLALFIQSRNSLKNGVDIHPGAQIGHSVMFDHATGIVIGETAIIESNVSILQGVTLGGTGKEMGDRHPKVCSGVMIGSGAKILGNIEIGEGAQVGAGSVVLKNVSPHTTVVGVPAVKVGKPSTASPCADMNQDVLQGADLSFLYFKGEGI